MLIGRCGLWGGQLSLRCSAAHPARVQALLRRQEVVTHRVEAVSVIGEQGMAAPPRSFPRPPAPSLFSPLHDSEDRRQPAPHGVVGDEARQDQQRAEDESHEAHQLFIDAGAGS